VQLAASGALSALAGAGLLDIDSRWVAICRFLFFFLLGWHAKHLIEGLARASSLLKVMAAAVVCVAAAGAAVVLGLRTVPGVAWALNCVAVVFGVLFAAWISKYVIGRPLVALGRLTLPIYLIHMLWLALIVAGVRYLDAPSAVASALPVVITIALVGLSLMTHRLLVRAGGTWLFAMPSQLAHRAPATQSVG
jgi:peptidoglycan/LPS O-acetylase OafA/YrhL